MNITPIQFSNQGYLQFELNEEHLLPIKKEVVKIQNNFDTSFEANKILAGHIDKEYKLFECHSHVEKTLFPLIENYVNNFNMPQYIDNILTDNVPYVLDNLWVNYQRKYEFNPTHVHSGVFSFVIWLNIPYDINEEKKVFSKLDQRKNRTSCFEFKYINTLGVVSTCIMDIDKSYEGRGIFFPSMLSHSVNPFYTSDEYRISVSGNIKYKV